MNGLIVLVLASGAVQAAEQKVHRDLPYAGTTHRLQTLDVYAPSGGSHHPVLVWIHGGGWRQGDKSNVQHKPQAFIQHGFVFVSVNYRLAPEVSLKEMAGDVAKAIRWVHDHIADYGGDPRAIYVAGHSAGAHLAALVCTDERYLSREKLSLELIKGCIPVDTAVYDVGQQIKESGPLRAQLYVSVFGEDPNLHREFSPIHHVAKAKGIPPFLILHVADRPDSTAQSRSFGAALQAASVYAKVVACKDKTHATINRDLGLADDYPTQEMFQFLMEMLGTRSMSVVSFEQGEERLAIRIDGQPIAEYVWRDERVLRPYFRHLRTLSGIQVTRTHPPVAGQDLDDHATMHPGLWLAFGDLSGADFWRNQARIRHVSFRDPPLAGAGIGTFTAHKVYEAMDRTICEEECRITIRPRSDGYIIDWTSTFFSSQDDFTFGDQEEMGLAVRLATPLAVVNGGVITDSQGRRNEEEIWGKTADWCQYGGVIGGRRVGVVLMPHPQNFRPCWFHARNYGLLAANPFGRNAFTGGEKSRVTVKRGESLTLRFGVLVYDVPQDQAPAAAEVFAEYASRRHPQ